MFRRSFIRVGCLLFLFATGCTPSQSDVEKSIRDEMKAGLGVTIGSIDLKKQADGSYSGTATTSSGDVYDVTTLPMNKDYKVEWKAVPGEALVEKIVRDGIAKQLGSNVATIKLIKNGPGAYSGPAELADGSKVNVTTKMEGTTLSWEAIPVQ